MKQNICVVIFLLLSTICKAQTFIYPQNDSILTEYNDGKFWAYLNKNDFVVGLSCFEEKDDYGKSDAGKGIKYNVKEIENNANNKREKSSIDDLIDLVGDSIIEYK